MRAGVVVLVAAAMAAPARADDAPKPIVGFRVAGHSKLTERTVGYLAHVKIGDPMTPGQIPQLEAALLSSELFETVKVTIEEAPGGLVVVATLADKQSWIIAPTAYLLGGNRAVGVGYVENNLLGQDRKLVLYGQYGNRTSLLFGTYFDPSVKGSPLMVRTDLYLLRRVMDEYVNPADDARSSAIGRTSTYTFLDAGVLVGWTFAWWLVADVRLRGAYVSYRDAHDASGNPLPVPEKDGWDISTQAHLTLDARKHRYGVSWGPYLQLVLDKSMPGLDSYGYGDALFRGYYSWRLFGEHEFELRTNLSAGYHLPAHEELTLGGQTDLRGYDLEQFHGDVRALYRAEYSVPMFRWRWFSFRAIGFYDGGYIGFQLTRPEDRDYLATQHRGASWTRNDVGAGLRVYLNSIVLPLLGLDFGYGIEGHSPEVYFEVGLTDF